MDLLGSLEGIVNSAAGIFGAANPTISFSPTSMVSSQIQLQPLSSTYTKDSSGNSVLSIPAQVKVENPFSNLIEWAGKIFNPVLPVNLVKTESAPRTLTTPVKNAVPDLSSIFNMAKDVITLGNNIFGSPSSQATPASATTQPLTLPAKQPTFLYYPSVQTSPTLSSISSLFSTTKTETTNTTAPDNSLWWIIIILAILMIVAMTRKG